MTEATDSNSPGTTPVELSMREAAIFVGVDKGTLSKHLRAGRVSSLRRDDQGRIFFQVSELLRAYPNARGSVAGNTLVGVDPNALQHPEQQGQHLLIDDLRRRLDEQKEERERERRQYQDSIDDLRRRLDASEEERRRKDERITALLTDQRQRADGSQRYEQERREEIAALRRSIDELRAEQERRADPTERRGFFARLFGGRGGS